METLAAVAATATPLQTLQDPHLRRAASAPSHVMSPSMTGAHLQKQQATTSTQAQQEQQIHQEPAKPEGQQTTSNDELPPLQPRNQDYNELCTLGG